MSDRGRSKTPRSLTRSPAPKGRADDDVSMGSRSPSPRGKTGGDKTHRHRSRSDMSISKSPERSRSREKKGDRGRARSISMSRSRSRSRSRRSRSRQPKNGGHRVVVVHNLSRNVHKGHLEEIFGHYGKVTGVDLPVARGCTLPLSD
jgi:RNA-binding protein with serine-rich domain 1